MKKYFDICVMALGVFLYFPFVYYGESSSLPSIFFAFFFPLCIYFSIRLSGKYYYWGGLDGDLSKRMVGSILFLLILGIQLWLVFIAVGLLLVVLYVIDSLSQYSLIRILILMLYNPIFAYLVMMFLVNWFFSKLGKTEFLSKLLANDSENDN